MNAVKKGMTRLAVQICIAGSLSMYNLEMTSAQTGDVPTMIQAALFIKVFGYEQKLAPKTKFSVCIPFASVADTVETDIAAQFRSINVSVNFINESRLSSSTLKQHDAIYFFSTVNAKSIRELAAKEGLLSITGNLQFVQEGTASVGIALENSKPRIVLNKSRAKLEKKEFSSDFVKAVKVIE